MKYSKSRIHKQRGFSLVEVILATAVFVILAVTGVATVLRSYTLNKMGQNQSDAGFYAQEGIEAVRSIKNRNWSSLTAGNYGLSSSGNNWNFSGSNDTKGIFTRQVIVSAVNRDVSGNIVASGGTLDTDTFKVTANVNWNATGALPESLSISAYISNFRKSISSGLIVYGDGTTIPKWRNYIDSTPAFGTESSAPTGASGRNFVVRTSPTKQEAIAAYTTNAGVLRVMCFDGTNWSEDWTVTVGGTATTRRFDIAYETNSGDVMVLYSNNVASTNELGYRTKAGTVACGSANWSAATNLDPLRTGGTVQWIKMDWDRRSSSNLIAAQWADSSSDLSAMIWSGSAWTNEPTTTTEPSLEVVATAQDVDDFDLKYESTSGDLMMVWANSAGANGTNGMRYRTCTGGTAACVWGVVTGPATFADDATNLDLSANPNNDEIVFASIGNAGSDLQIGYWSGSGWINNANVDITCATPVAGSKLVTTGWLTSGGTTRSIVVYNDNGATNVGWYVGNGVTFTAQTDFTPTPAFASPQVWYYIQSDSKNKDRLLLSLSDNAGDLFAKRLIMTSVPAFTWANADGSAALELTLGQTIVSPFSFAYWRNP